MAKAAKDKNVFDYKAERERICSTVKSCKECPIGFFNNKIGHCCITFEHDYPEVAYGLVKDWSVKNPPQD